MDATINSSLPPATLDMTVGTIAVGDRVEVTRRCDHGDVFGCVKQLLDNRRVVVQLEDGDALEIDRSKLAHAPDRETILQRCQLIQEAWTPPMRLSRMGLAEQSDHALTIPEIHDQWDAGLLFYGGIDR